MPRMSDHTRDMAVWYQKLAAQKAKESSEAAAESKRLWAQYDEMVKTEAAKNAE